VTRRYLIVEAAGYHLLIDAALIDGVSALTPGFDSPVVDLCRALGGTTAALVVACDGNAQVGYLGVEGALGLVDLAEEDLVPLPALVAAAAGEDIDRVTRLPLRGAHAFRLRLGHSSAATAASDHPRSPPSR
jgi:hypothetical protein